MSASTSATDSTVYATRRAPQHLDADFAAMNVNSGTGVQSNYLQTGIHNTQYNAQTQTFYTTTQPSSDEEKIAECQSALLTIRPEDHRATIISTKGERVAGTCEWIRNNAEYQSLLRGETRLLCIQGGPGKGKTMLSVFLTQELERMGKVIYFFCQADDEARRSATYVLRSLIWQFTVLQPATARHLTHYLYPPDQKQAVLTSKESLWSIFVKITDDPLLTRSFCLLDGLDECDDESQRWLAMKFTDLCKSHDGMPEGSCVRIMIISRPGILALRASKRVVLDPDHSDQISHDIGAFVRSKVQDLSKQLENLADDTRAEFEARMQNELLTRAEGTFLWVGFAMIELLKKCTRTQMEDAIQELPVGLTAMYDRMLLQIDPLYRATCSKILQWVAFATRPLHIDEMEAVLHPASPGLVSTQQNTLDHLTICGAFITISKDMISLVHESARDYFALARDPHNVALECFHLQPSLVHLEITTTCLLCIEQMYRLHTSQVNLNQNDTDSTRSQHTSGNTWHQPLTEYAIRRWPEHVRLSGDSFERLQIAVPLFFARNSSLRDWWYGMFLEASPDDFEPVLPMSIRFGRPYGIPALHTACYLGLESWVTRLLRPRLGIWKRSERNRPCGSKGHTPLIYAAARGHISIVDQLLRHRAKINTMDKFGMTALHHAVMQERVAVVDFLLKRGATTDPARQEWLHVATATGNIDLIRPLLGHTTNRGVRKADGDTPLHFASKVGGVAVIQYLLDNGADVHSRNIKQETPLHMAASEGRAEESQLLLRHGATVDARSDSGETPLHSAATNGYLCERLTKIFLAAGADVNARSHTGRTPLHDAARAGESNEVVHVLLRSGAKVDARTESGMTPLHEAARCTEPIQCIVRELLKAGAEIDSLDNNGHSPLDWALRYGSSRNVGVLIEHGAKVSAAAKLPLFQGAVASCDAQVVKVLLERGFRSLVNTPDSDGSTPLHLAIIARWIWLNGPKDNDGWSRTSTDCLAYDKEQQVSVVLLLLNNGADIEALDAQGATALHHAIGFGTEQVISVLLEYGADVAVKAGDGKTALQMAKAIGNDASVRMLIQHGARDEVGVQDQPRERPARRKFRFFAGK